MRVSGPKKWVMRHLITHKASETYEEGVSLGKSLAPNSVLAFYGELGAGKTTFIKGVVYGASGVEAHEVTSPTFTYMHIYEGTLPVYHFDLYRLRSAHDFLSLGFAEYLTYGGICCIEWSERIAEILPQTSLHVTLKHLGNEQREIIIL